MSSRVVSYRPFFTEKSGQAIGGWKVSAKMPGWEVQMFFSASQFTGRPAAKSCSTIFATVMRVARCWFSMMSLMES